MINTRSNNDQKTEEKPTKQKNVPVTETDLEKPEQSIINKRLKCSDEIRQELKKELRHITNEKPDSYFNLAKATEEELR